MSTRTYKTLLDVERAIKHCVLCPLHSHRTNAVPGEGTGRVGLMFIGEAPGRNEDLQGRPFVGAAGQLLTKLIASELGLSREDVYITNVIKCRPPGNRDPQPSEIITCWPYLEAQIKLLKPKVIVTLGRHAATTILHGPGSQPASIMRVRGQPRSVTIAGIDVIVLPTLHPAAALYNKALTPVLEEDFRKVAALLREGQPRRRVSLNDYRSTM